MVIQGDRILTPRPQDRSPSIPSLTTIDAFASTNPPASADATRPTASSGAAKKVMDWFRRKSLAKGPFPAPSFKRENTSSSGRSGYPGGLGVLVPAPESIRTEEAALSSSTSDIGQGGGPPTPTVVITSEPALEDELIAPVEADPTVTTLASASMTSVAVSPLASAKINSPILSAKPQRAKSHGPGTYGGARIASSADASTSAEARLRIHAGVVDQAALTSQPAKDVIAEVIRVLFDMGIEVKRESDFRLRCTRPRRKKAGASIGLGLSSVVSGGSLASLAIIGSASTSGVSHGHVVSSEFPSDV
jgi:protein-serine/threonine kinase